MLKCTFVKKELSSSRNNFHMEKKTHSCLQFLDPPKFQTTTYYIVSYFVNIPKNG